MHERLSFYVRRDSPLHRRNPLTKLLLAFTLVIVAFFFPWFWTAPLLIVLIIIPLAFVGKVQREYLSTAGKLLLPAVGFVFVMQTLFLPGHETILFQWWIFKVSLENLTAAFRIASRIFVMVSSFILFLLTTHPSQLMSDLTRRKLPSMFAYVIISTLQIIPQMQAKAQTIIAAQQSRGLETSGSLAQRIRALVPLVGPLVFGSLVEVEERAIAIEARAFTSSLPKTSLHEILDPPLDRRMRWLFLVVIVLTVVSRIWLS